MTKGIKGFQKGNTAWQHPNAKRNQIGKGQRLSPSTEFKPGEDRGRRFKKGQPSPRKGTGKHRITLVKYAWQIVEHSLRPRKCERCASTIRLQIHHKNRDWSDNAISNLEILCTSCHAKEHVNDPNSGTFKKGHEYRKH